MSGCCSVLYRFYPSLFQLFLLFRAATAFLLMQLVMMLCLGRARQLWRVKNPKPEMKSGMCECSAVAGVRGGQSNFLIVANL